MKPEPESKSGYRSESASEPEQEPEPGQKSVARKDTTYSVQKGQKHESIREMTDLWLHLILWRFGNKVFLPSLAVHIQHPVVYRHNIPCQRNDPLDEHLPSLESLLLDTDEQERNGI